MRQMLLSLLSRERREAVMPYVTTARAEENVITVEAPEKIPMTLSPPLAGELLAHDVITQLCQETRPMSESPVTPFAWLFLAQDGLEDPLVESVLESAEAILASQWGTRTPGRTRSKMFRSILRPNPPAIVILSGEETPTGSAAAHRIAGAFTRQRMVSPYAEQSIIQALHNNPDWLIEEKSYNPRGALRRLEQLVTHDVSEGKVQPHAVVILDGDNPPEPLAETVDIILALTCMSEEAQRHPALQGHRNNLFPVVVKKP